MRLIWTLIMTLSAQAAMAADFGSVPIAPANEALTFARTSDENGSTLILVSSYENGKIRGVNVAAALGTPADDPISVYNAKGHDTLAALADRDPDITVPVTDLGLPVDLTASHIAVGTNFPAHAEEATVEDGPFLFPKEVVPTAFNAPVSQGEALLDYEVELCFVPLDALDLAPPTADIGLILCNDVTDRAALMRHIDPSDVTSGIGFTTGKSAPGFLPVGNLFVIPRDARAFAPAIELRLYRDGDLKQSARQSQAIWDLDEILRQSHARENVRWEYQGEPVGLPIHDGKVPPHTAILGGTPDGTVFQGIERMAIVRGVLDWILGGWDQPVTHWIVERQIERSKAKGIYLRAGERVQIRVDYLGEIDNTIVP